MKFEEILPFLRSGHKIRSSEWDEGIYIYINEDKIVNQDNMEYIVSLDDLRSDCWEVKLVHLSGSKEFIFIKVMSR